MLNKVYRYLLKILGDIKIFKFPMFLLYQPKGYTVKGAEIDKLRNLLKPGDFLLRGYYNYLDGYLIPGFFSHAGFYHSGDKVIHSIAEGVLEEHIFDFCRCDFITVMRFKEGAITEKDILQAQEKSIELIGSNYDFEADENDNEYYCTEFVKKVWEHKKDLLKLEPTEFKVLLGLIKKKILLPDQFRDSDVLKVVFTSQFAS